MTGSTVAPTFAPPALEPEQLEVEARLLAPVVQLIPLRARRSTTKGNGCQMHPFKRPRNFYLTVHNLPSISFLP